MDDQPNNAFAVAAPESAAPRKSTPPDDSRARTQPDNAPLNWPGDKPTKHVIQGPGSNQRGPMSGLEAAMSAQADQLHKTGKLAPGKQSRG